MSGCGHCAGCSKCGSCRGGLELNEGELHVLQALGQIPFLPIARMAADEMPVYLAAEEYSREEYSPILQCLERKELISLDYDAPIKGFDGYGAYLIRGSMALTARGQQVLELLEIQGAE